MSAEFEAVITALAPVAAMLLSRTGAGRSDAADSRCDSLLRTSRASLEDDCPRIVSTRAREKAERLGLGGLRRFRWNDRNKRVLRRHAQLFRWNTAAEAGIELAHPWEEPGALDA